MKREALVPIDEELEREIRDREAYLSMLLCRTRFLYRE